MDVYGSTVAGWPAGSPTDAHAEALPQKSESHLDRVSTGSDSDLVSDQHVIFLMILDPPWCDQVAIAPCTDPIQVRFRLLRQSAGLQRLDDDEGTILS